MVACFVRMFDLLAEGALGHDMGLPVIHVIGSRASKEQLEEMKIDTEELMNKPFAQGAIDQKERMQRMQ